MTSAIFGRDVGCDPFRVGGAFGYVFRGRCPRLLYCAPSGQSSGSSEGALTVRLPGSAFGTNCGVPFRIGPYITAARIR